MGHSPRRPLPPRSAGLKKSGRSEIGMTTLLIVVALLLGFVGTILGMVSLRFALELAFHLPDVLEQIREEQDGNLRLRSYVLFKAYQILHP
jgi:hypothetical protein